MSKFIKNLYKVFAYHLPETTLTDVIDNLLKTGHISTIPHKLPIKNNIPLLETFDSLELIKDRKISQEIFRSLYNTIYTNLSQNERDMIGMYKTYGFNASFPYDIDEHRLTSIYNILDDDNSFIIKTRFGDLTFKFAERDEYNTNIDTLLGYEDQENKILIFVDDGKNITTLDIINILTNDNYLHEFQHFIDNISNKFINNEYDKEDLIAYLNSPNEFKGNLQMILGSFGRFLFKNVNKINLLQLKDKNEVKKLLSVFLGYRQDKKFDNVINSNTQEMFRKEIFYLNEENKNEFYKQLYKYTSDYYNTNDDIDFTESINLKKEMIRLFRLEENFIDL